MNYSLRILFAPTNTSSGSVRQCQNENESKVLVGMSLAMLLSCKKINCPHTEDKPYAAQLQQSPTVSGISKIHQNQQIYIHSKYKSSICSVTLKNRQLISQSAKHFIARDQFGWFYCISIDIKTICSILHFLATTFKYMIKLN